MTHPHSPVCELTTVIELMHEAAADRPLPEFMALVAERFAVVLGLDRVVIWSVEPDRQTGRRLATFGPPVYELPDAASLADLPVVRLGLESERAAVASCPATGRGEVAGNGAHRGELVLAPLRVGDRVHGVIIGDRNGDEVWLRADQLALAQAVANQAALALDRTRLLEVEQARSDQLAAVLEHVSEAVFATDVAGRMSLMNAAGRALIGIEADTLEVTGDLLELVNRIERRTLTGDPIPPEEVPLVRAARGEVVEQQRHFVVTPDGAVKPVSVTARPIRGTTGEPCGAVALVRDITLDQAKAEHQARQVTQLQAAAAHSEAVADIALAVNAGTDLGGSLRAAIEQMTIALGGASGAIYFQDSNGSLVPQVAFPPALDAMPPVELAKAPSALIAFSSRQPLFFTAERASPPERLLLDGLGARAILLTPLIAGDEIIGAALVGYASAESQPSADQLRLASALANQCAVGIEKVRLMERIESEHQRLLAVVDHLPLGVIIVEAPSGSLVLANQTAEELIGGPVPERVAGALLLEKTDGSLLPPQQDPLSLTLTTGRGRFGETLGLRRPDGSVVRVLANYVPVRDAGGRVVGAVSVLQDVAQLQALDNAKDEFLSIAAHELRNPLTSLHGNLQLMLRRMRNDPERADDVSRLETIQAQSERLRQLVSRLLDVSRAELGRLDLALAESDAATIVRRTADAARGLSSVHQIIVEGPNELPVMWDTVRIEQVLTNLIGNAIKYTPQGTVRVSLDLTHDEWVRIAVQDEGPGIPEHVQASLFERYVRGRPRVSGEKPEGGGLGLGLYISRLIARTHGGDLTATNAEGGARFVLAVPRVARPS